ncbi:hypothetical protein GCM10009682_59740 [Luedemannella flava]|uniref:Uncharacterized protein n=1 Tax=Luedemannella flava TaxID=349316 RepID=A0ABN2MPA2_9ACTN
MGSAVGATAVALGAGAVITAGAASADETTVEPAYGAGLFDVDPDQGSISQDPGVAVTGIDAMSEDWGF